MFVENDPTLVALLKAGAIITLPGGYRFEAVKDGDRHLVKFTRPDKTLPQPVLSVDEPTEFWRQVEFAGLVTERLSGQTRRKMKDAILKPYPDDALDRLVDALIDDMPDSALIQYVEANTKFFDPPGEDDDEEDGGTLDIRYRCPDCGHKWVESGDSACDSECPKCGTENITAYDYVDEGDTFDADPEWDGRCERCAAPLTWQDTGHGGTKAYLCSKPGCEFHAHRQQCPAGWKGQPNLAAQIAHGNCECKWDGTKM